MKVEITKAQLQAISELCGNAEASLGAGGDIESKDYGLDDYDKDTIKALKLIGRFFNKNGYDKPTRY